MLSEHVPLHVPLDSQPVAEVAQDSGLIGLPLAAAPPQDVPLVNPLEAARTLLTVDPVGSQAIGEGEALQAFVADILKWKEEN